MRMYVYVAIHKESEEEEVIEKIIKQKSFFRHLPLHFQKEEIEAPAHHRHQSFPTSPSIPMPVLLPADTST
jgi:hypothetical protein